MDVLAEQLQITEKRLTFMLRLTRPLLSTDAPFMRGGGTRAGKAGDSFGYDLRVSDTLVDDTELNSEDMVELSLLRQSLENAMATELSPHERDVLRLRLGLDDGVTRSCREVSEEFGGRLKSAEIRATEKRALKKLRSPVSLATYKLLTFLDFANVDKESVKLR
jgi:DNA-directed RNA polymerase sigma subunit (sigma70/sigma32)